MTRTLVRPLALLVPVLLLTACSGAEVPLGSGRGQGGGFGAGGGVGTGGIPFGSGAGGTMATGGTPATGGPSATGGTSGGGGQPFGAGPDAAVGQPDAPPDAFAPGDFGAPPDSAAAEMCGSATCASGSICCRSSCGGINGEPVQQVARCTPGASCPVAPAVVVACNGCTADADCVLGARACGFATCECRAFPKSGVETPGCTSCEGQACAGKTATCVRGACMVGGAVPPPPAVPGR